MARVLAGRIEGVTMRQATAIGLLLWTAGVLVGCKTTKIETTIQYDRPLPPGQLALQKITDPNEIPISRRPGTTSTISGRPSRTA